MNILTRPEIAVAILSFLGTLIGSITAIIMANRITVYRIDELEKKVEKHNNLVERMVKLEGSDTAQWKWIDQLKK